MASRVAIASRKRPREAMTGYDAAERIAVEADEASVEQAIAALDHLDHAALKARWRTILCDEPTQGA
jgi:hypothetical protein